MTWMLSDAQFPAVAAPVARSGSPGGGERVVLLCGPEARSKEEALARLVQERVAGGDPDLDVQHFDASAPGFNSAAGVAAARDRGMFSLQRVVVVRHAEQLREPRHERSRELMARALPSLPEHATVIFVTGGEDEGGRTPALGEKLTTAIREHGRSVPPISSGGPVAETEL